MKPECKIKFIRFVKPEIYVLDTNEHHKAVTQGTSCSMNHVTLLASVF